MKKKIKISALDYRGKKTTVLIYIDCPNFKAIPASEKFGVKFPEISIDSQVMEWYDLQDKSALMAEMDLYMILDYSIVQPQSQKPTMVDALKEMNLSPEMLLDVMACYKQIKPILKGKSLKSQLELLFSHINIGYDAASEAYNHMSKLLKAPTLEDMRKMISK